MGSLAKRYIKRRARLDSKSIGFAVALLAAVGRVNRKRRSPDRYAVKEGASPEKVSE